MFSHIHHPHPFQGEPIQATPKHGTNWHGIVKKMKSEAREGMHTELTE